uniref:Leucine rich repeat containing 74A n=1 Tax=Sinocyclocheilus anshuiensis TaxID=1608454 RepID=A0A671QB65_9TELE
MLCHRTCVRLMTNSATINLNHHGLGPMGAKALAIALVTDMHTTTLELADNSLLAKGARYLMEMLRANFTIHNLVNECVAKMLLESISIKSLKMSGISCICAYSTIRCNYRVKELDLSHNRMMNIWHNKCMYVHAANNDGLEVLDLSWNHLRMKAAVAFCAGLKVPTHTHSSHTFQCHTAVQIMQTVKAAFPCRQINTTLKHLDLSFNGFGNEGGDWRPTTRSECYRCVRLIYVKLD